MKAKENKTQKRSILFSTDTLDALEKLANKEKKTVSDLVREFVNKGLSLKSYTEEIDFIREQIREELNIILKPQIERLATLSVKGGVMSAASFYLLGDVISAFVPERERKDFTIALDKARKLGITYYRLPTDDEDDDGVFSQRREK